MGNRRTLPIYVVTAVMIISMIAYSYAPDAPGNGPTRSVIGPEAEMTVKGDQGSLMISIAEDRYKPGDMVDVEALFSGNRTMLTLQLKGPENETHLLESGWIGRHFEVLLLDDNVANYTAPTVVLDAIDNPYISYYSEGKEALMFAHFDGTDWNISEVFPTGRDRVYSSIALDSQDRPHIVFQDIWNSSNKYGHVKVASWTGTDWNVTNVTTVRDRYEYVDIDVDSNGVPHVIYSVFEKGLEYATWNGTAWNNETVDSPDLYAIQYIWLELDDNDNAHMSYRFYAYGDQRYANNIGGSWNITQIDNSSTVGVSSVLRIDSKGYPHISYVEKEISLRYAYWNGSDWMIEIIDNTSKVFGMQSMDLDENDDPHFTYVDNFNGTFRTRYARRYDDGWLSNILDGQAMKGRVSLAAGSGMITHFAYYLKVPGELYYTTYDYSTMNQSFQFKLPIDAPPGEWTLHTATQDGNAVIALNFVVEALPPPSVFEFSLLDYPSQVKPGGTFWTTVNVTNTYNASYDYDLALQVKNEDKEPLTPLIMNLSIGANTTDEYNLTVAIPNTSEEGSFWFQINLLNGLPEDEGYAIQASDGEFEVKD